MHRSVNLDSEGRLIIEWEPLLNQVGVECAREEKREDINRLRKVQSTGLIGRSALKVVEFFSADKHRAA